jgi:uncharacterized protein YdaU (DUF1376 family)
MHYFQFNIGDYTSHTSHLDLIEDIAYRRMLDWYYTHEKPLPKDVQEIARQIRMRDNAAAIRDVLNEFFELTEEGWYSSRVDREIQHYKSKVEQASRAGKASAERRLNGRSTDVQPTNNHKPITSNQKKERTRSVDQTLPEWLQSLNGEAPIPKDSAVLKFAESAGIPFDYIRIAWVHFKRTMTEKQKRQKDWRKTFNLYVQKDYLRLWAFNQNNECYLTTAGKQVLNSLQSEAA